MLMPPQIYAWVLSAILLGGIGTGAYFYYKTTSATIKTLRAELVLTDVAIAERDNTIATLTEEAVANEENYSALVYRNRVAEQYQDKLLDILHKHDLTNLASKKPGLIENRINEGTQNVLDSLERTSSDGTSQ